MNSDVLGEFDFNSDGYAVIPSALLNGSGSDRATLLIHQLGNETSYLSLLEEPLSLDQLPVDGRVVGQLGDAYLRTERGVYRGGQSVHMSGIARHKSLPLADEKLKLQIFKPDGDLMSSAPVTTDVQGVFVHSHLLGADPKRGKYRVELQRSGSIIASTKFLVEDFVPETMKKVAQIPNVLQTIDDVSIETDNLFIWRSSIQTSYRSHITSSISRNPFQTCLGMCLVR